MKVLLLDSVEKLGKVGDIVEVARGYGRNFLLPRNLAVLATVKQVKHHEDRVKRLRQKLEEEIGKKKELASSVSGVSLVVTKKITKDGKLFGSVTKKDVNQAFKDTGLTVRGFEIDLGTLPKKVGKYKIKLNFGFDVEESVDLEIKGE